MFFLFQISSPRFLRPENLVFVIIVFFNAVIKGEALVPEETLFLDDGPRNIAAADALGIKTLLVDNGEDWTGKIEEKLKALS